jgi:hypothetical protein
LPKLPKLKGKGPPLIYTDDTDGKSGHRRHRAESGKAKAKAKALTTNGNGEVLRKKQWRIDQEEQDECSVKAT